ncbi:MAG: Fur family transcriptional regulator [Parvularculaceae bacterium]
MDDRVSGSTSEGGDAQVAPKGLTKNERLVWRALSAASEPLKAYEILDHLKNSGVRAPMTVYRALDGLEQKGLIHKLEGLNAFVLCNHDAPHDVQVFTVCDKCAAVKEVEVASIEALISEVVRRTGFSMTLARLEVRGRCETCPSPSSSPIAA